MILLPAQVGDLPLPFIAGSNYEGGSSARIKRLLQPAKTLEGRFGSTAQNRTPGRHVRMTPDRVSFGASKESALWANMRVRRETGKEHVVQVHYDEGVATRIGPAPCAGAREGIGEASAGACAGQPSSRESGLNSGADAVLLAEGDTEGRVIASARTTRRGRRP